jgi:hypothetical protein
MILWRFNTLLLAARLDHLLQELDMMACRLDLAVYATVMACGEDFADKSSPMVTEIRFSCKRLLLWSLW